MNSILFFEDETSENLAVCEGERAKYLYLIHGIREGTNSLISVWNRGRGRGTCRFSSRERVEFELKLDLPPRPHLPVHFVVGASRPQTTKKVIHFAAMSGVSSLTFVGTENGEKSYLSSKVFSERSIKEEAAKGLEQSFDCNPPEIRVVRIVREFIASQSIKAEGEHRIIAQPGSKNDAVPKISASRRITIAIGPEAGWSEMEEAQFEEAGYTPVSLGERVLRVEFAAAYILGAISS